MNGTILDLPFSIDFIVEKLKNPLCKIENLVSFKAEEICKGVGFFSRIIRVIFHWKLDEIEPKSVILKIPIAEGEDCIIHLEYAFEREINFYEIFAKNHPDLKIPKFFYGYKYSRHHSKGISIQEDLTQKAATARILPGLTNEQVEAVIDELAKICAYSLQNKDWFKFFVEDENQEDFMHDMFKEAQALLEINHDVYKPMLEKANSLRFYTYRTNQMRSYTEDKYGFPPTLVHSDLWTANILFEKDKNGNLTSNLVAIIDWQDVHPGNPCEDIARLLSINTPVKYRRENTKRLLKFYMERVDFYSGKKAPFTFEQLLDAYKNCLPYAFAYLSFGAPYYYKMSHVVDGSSPGEYKEELLDRVQGFFEDVLVECDS